MNRMYCSVIAWEFGLLLGFERGSTFQQPTTRAPHTKLLRQQSWAIIQSAKSQTMHSNFFAQILVIIHNYRTRAYDTPLRWCDTRYVRVLALLCISDIMGTSVVFSYTAVWKYLLVHTSIYNALGGKTPRRVTYMRYRMWHEDSFSFVLVQELYYSYSCSTRAVRTGSSYSYIRST